MDKVAFFKNGVLPAFLLSLLVSLQIGFVSFARAESADPKEVYAKAWQTIKEKYLDQTFGGQNWSRWNHRYDRRIDTQEDADRAIETMLASLGDPYTRFLNNEAFNEERTQIQAKLYGVGMQLGMNKEQKVVVIAPIEGSPAMRAGARAGDIVTAINGTPVTGLALDAVVKQIRGPEGTHVNITFTRGAQKVEVSMTRAAIAIKAVADASILPGNIGYIRLDSFISSTATDEVKTALNTVKSADGIILDLRNNPGGLLSNAVAMADLFLPAGLTVVETESDGIVKATTTQGNLMSQQPLVVLVNNGSASASEILSAALRDNGRAKLIGETTFGKGIVQGIFPLPGGSGMNCTIARYLTPKHVSLNKIGIEPDYKVVLKKWDKDSKDAWQGPWWMDPNYTNFNRTPTDGSDIQLRKAIWAVRNQIAFSKGLPMTPDPDANQVASADSGGGGGTVAVENNTTSSENNSSENNSSTSTTAAALSKNRPIADKWALIVGISRFQNPSLDLKFPAKDAQDLAKFLVNNCNFASDHVKVLTDNGATRAAIMNELGDKWLPRVVKPDDLVLLYFSTHGSPSEMDVVDVNYLLAWDSDPDTLFSSGVAMQDLMRVIKKRIRSDRVVVMLDACYSGNVDPRAKGIHRQANIDAAEIAQGTGQLVISSSAPNQVSWESSRQANSVFTRHLLNALSVNGNRTKLGEAFRILKDRVEDEVQQDRGRMQTPMLKSQWEGAELMLSVRPVAPRAGLNTARPDVNVPARPVVKSPARPGVNAGDK